MSLHRIADTLTRLASPVSPTEAWLQRREREDKRRSRPVKASVSDQEKTAAKPKPNYDWVQMELERDDISSSATAFGTEYSAHGTPVQRAEEIAWNLGYEHGYSTGRSGIGTHRELDALLGWAKQNKYPSVRKDYMDGLNAGMETAKEKNAAAKPVVKFKPFDKPRIPGDTAYAHILLDGEYAGEIERVMEIEYVGMGRTYRVGSYDVSLTSDRLPEYEDTKSFPVSIRKLPGYPTAKEALKAAKEWVRQEIGKALGAAVAVEDTSKPE